MTFFCISFWNFIQPNFWNLGHTGKGMIIKGYVVGHWIVSYSVPTKGVILFIIKDCTSIYRPLSHKNPAFSKI